MFSRVRRNDAPPPVVTNAPVPQPPADEVAGVAAPQDVLEVAAVPGHFEAPAAIGDETHLNLMEKCGGFNRETGTVSVDLKPQFWAQLKAGGTKAIEYAYTDALIIAGGPRSTASSTVQILEEAGLTEGQDLKHIAGQVKAARSLLEEHEGKNSLKRPSAKKYKKETGGGDLKNDLAVYKASQAFREHLLQIADKPSDQRQSALDALVKSFEKLVPVKIIALYRLNKSFA